MEESPHIGRSSTSPSIVTLRGDAHKLLGGDEEPSSTGASCTTSSPATTRATSVSVVQRPPVAVSRKRLTSARSVSPSSHVGGGGISPVRLSRRTDGMYDMSERVVTVYPHGGGVAGTPKLMALRHSQRVADFLWRCSRRLNIGTVVRLYGAQGASIDDDEDLKLVRDGDVLYAAKMGEEFTRPMSPPSTSDEEPDATVVSVGVGVGVDVGVGVGADLPVTHDGSASVEASSLIENVDDAQQFQTDPTAAALLVAATTVQAPTILEPVAESSREGDEPTLFAAASTSAAAALRKSSAHRKQERHGHRSRSKKASKHTSSTDTTKHPSSSVVASILDDVTPTTVQRLVSDKREWVTLNVGGRIFSTTRQTLTKDPNSMLAKMFGDQWVSSTDSDGAYLIDRSPDYFAPILNYLRCGRLVLDQGVNPEGVLEEAAFFNVTGILPELTELVESQRKPDHFTRKDLCSILLTCSTHSTLRCQGIDLEGCDLSRLDLSNINFQLTNLAYANLSHCNLDNAQFQGAILDHANLDKCSLRGANLSGASLEEACLRGANFEDRRGQSASLEGANLKGADCEDANFSGANLRVVNFKDARLSQADLRRADMAGSNLENCLLTGCNLYKANLYGANVHGAKFDIRSVSSR